MTHTVLRPLALATATLALTAGALAAPAQAAPPPVSDPAEVPGYFSLADRLVEEAHAVGVVAQVQKNKQTWSYAAGRAVKGKPRPPALDAKFRAASVTKQLVSVLALQEVEAGRLSLESTLGEILPGVWPGREATTLRQLLSHSSGIPDYLPAYLLSAATNQEFLDAIGIKATDPELVALAQQLPAVAEPGVYSYSNTNFVLAGMMLEQVTGTRVGELMQERILGPAKMRDSSFPSGRVVAGPRLKEYLVVGKRRYDLSGFQPSTFSSAGALVSTAGDLNRFRAALDGGRLLERASLREMQKAQVVDTASGLEYGLGSYVLPGVTCGKRAVLGHDGASWGTQTMSFSAGNKRVTIAASGRDLTPARAFDQGKLLVRFVSRAFASVCGGPGQQGTSQRPAVEDFAGLDVLSPQP